MAVKGLILKFALHARPESYYLWDKSVIQVLVVVFITLHLPSFKIAYFVPLLMLGFICLRVFLVKGIVYYSCIHL